MNIATAIRTAADTALRADAATVAAFGSSAVRLYPLTTPNPPVFPYIRMLVQVIGDYGTCGEENEVNLTLEIFAREGSYEESVDTVEAIAGAARKALTRELPMTGHVMDDWRFEGDRPVSDLDVLTAHRSVSITYLTSASA
ncbi:hypothetical protein D3C71_230830 [compost metagenome]